MHVYTYIYRYIYIYIYMCIPVMTRTGGSGGTTATLGILRGGGTTLGIITTSTFGLTTAVALCSVYV
jgi:hypothetical protein